MSLDSLIEAHLHLPHEVARGLQNRLSRRVCYDDLVSLGLIGLLDAARRFQPARGVAFRTYARHRIRGEILDGLRMYDHLSRHDRNLFRRAEQQMHRLTASLGRLPDESETAGAMALPLHRWQELRSHFGRLGLLGQIGAMPEIDEIPDWSFDPHHSARTAEVRRGLCDLIQTLPLRERLIIRLHYGRDVNFGDIAKKLGVGQSRISQLHKRALTHLREQIQLKKAAR